jgi:hypothetical protein
VSGNLSDHLQRFQKIGMNFFVSQNKMELFKFLSEECIFKDLKLSTQLMEQECLMSGRVQQ